ncbi:hypothetical protein B296_00009023 [Ensete ventricosum]|uniref:Uncharacterized protein n=1 Tax=Ensete ventricosum TaxID=4639 RepID=A0A426YYT4_ENSVE|nr:hypothetical protein B296_00009023 [Ensete ventricosum]
MKSYYDIASVISEEALESIRECYSIPEGYALRAPSPEQRPYQTQPSELRGILPLSRAIQDMTERWLVEAWLSPASRGTMDLNMLRKKPQMLGGKGAPAADP